MKWAFHPEAETEFILAVMHLHRNPDYWKNKTGEGVMLVGPEFGRLFTSFHDEELIFVDREQA